MRSNFIDKVYDTYVSNDFSYGVDNLNPVREIDLSSTKSIDDKIAEIYAELNKRVANVKKTVSDLIGKSEDELYTGNTVSESNNGSDNSHLKNIIGLTGSSGDKIVIVPYFEEDMDPMTLELELMFLEKLIQGYYPDPKPPKPDSDKGGDDDGFDVDLPPFIPDCTILEGSSSNNDNNQLGNGSEDEKDTEIIKTKVYPRSEGGTLDPNNLNIDTAKIADALNDALLSADKANEENEKNQAACARAELGVLKMILAVLKVIKMIRQMMDPAMAIIMQAIKIVQLAAQCWNNPTCIGVIIQRVLGTVIAILMGVVATLIAEIWKMLGLDCFSAEAQALMDEIREALAAIGNIVSELDPTGIITDVKTAINSIEDTFDTVSNNIKNTVNTAEDSLDNLEVNMKQSLRGALESAGFAGLTDEQFSSFLSNPRYRARILDTVAKVAPSQVSDIKKLVDDVLSIPDDIAKAYNTVRQMVGTLSSEKQLMATWDDVKNF